MGGLRTDVERLTRLLPDPEGVAAGLVPTSYAYVDNFGVVQYGYTLAAPGGGGGSGTVTSVDVSGGSTGLAFTGGPVTTSGTITASGTLAIASGGTGQTTAPNAINALLPSQGGNSGKVLGTNGTVASWVAGGGTGTVTNFSAGNLSPLFTSSVATSTTTPALTFALVNQTANLVYAGPGSGGAAAPTFRALVALDIPALAYQVQIQFKDEGSNVGSLGAITSFDVIGDGAQLSVVGTAATLTVPNPVQTFDLSVASTDYDDFTVPVSSASAASSNKTVYVIGGSAPPPVRTSDPAGTLNLVTGGGASDFCRLFGCPAIVTAVSGCLTIGGGGLDILMWFSTKTLSNATNRYSLINGLRDRAATGASNDEMTFVYSDNINTGKATLQVNAAGGGLVQTSGVTTILANTSYRARISVNAAGTSVSLYLRPAGGAEVLECTYSGTLPLPAIGLGIIMSMNKTVGLGVVSMDARAWQWRQTFTSSR